MTWKEFKDGIDKLDVGDTIEIRYIDISCYGSVDDLTVKIDDNNELTVLG